MRISDWSSDVCSSDLPESVRSGAMTRPADALTLPSELVVLGIETSCDETAAAVVTARGEIRANLVLSQLDAHRPYGRVVPEIAARSPRSAERRVGEAGVSMLKCSWSTLHSKKNHI